MFKNHAAVVFLLGTLSSVMPSVVLSESALIGDAELRLGMTKEEVSKILDRHQYSLVRADEKSSLVLTKDKDELLGGVSFSNGSLVTIRRNWSLDNQQEGADLAKALFGSVKSVTSEGSSTCLVWTEATQNPGIEMEDLFIRCGNRLVNLTLLTRRGKEDEVSLSEVLTEGVRLK